MSTEDTSNRSSSADRPRSVDFIESQRWTVMLGRVLPLFMGLMPVAEVIENTAAREKLASVAAPGTEMLADVHSVWNGEGDPPSFGAALGRKKQ